MRTVTYKSVLDKISGQLGEDDGMSVADAGLAVRLTNTFVRGAWEYYYWPELTPIERRQFRPSYDGTAVVAGDERYYVPARKYYQALRASTGQAPATLTGSDYVLNAAYWAESQGGYSGPDWATGQGLNVGDIRRNPDDDMFYQCITAHTTGATFDATKFGALTNFVRSIDYEQAGETALGEVKKIWDRDPDGSNTAREIAKVLRPDYVLVRGTQPRVWVEFRKRPNQFTNVAWVAGFYAAGDLRYYDLTGECYEALTATTALPTDATQWRKVDFPYIFAEFTAQSVYAALVAKEDQVPEDFSVEISAGFPLLQLELQKIERQQGQTRQLNVVH